MNRKSQRWTWLGVVIYLVMTLGLHAMQIRNGGCNGKCACVLSETDPGRTTDHSDANMRGPNVHDFRD